MGLNRDGEDESEGRNLLTALLPRLVYEDDLAHQVCACVCVCVTEWQRGQPLLINIHSAKSSKTRSPGAWGPAESSQPLFPPCYLKGTAVLLCRQLGRRNADAARAAPLFIRQVTLGLQLFFF